MKGPSELIRTVYREHIDKFGEPDNSVVFGGGEPIKGEEHIPSRIEVLIWRANEDIDINVFATIGMSDKPMNGADYRAELHFAVSGELTDAEISKICTFLANIAVHPFTHNTHFDWSYLFSSPEPIPCFDSATAILFYSAFTDEGLETIDNAEKLVKILNLVPITEDERLLMKDEGIDSLTDYWDENDIDIFQRR